MATEATPAIARVRTAGWWHGLTALVSAAALIAQLILVVLNGINPLTWGAYTLVHGAISGWYPYPFVDLGELGYGGVLLSYVGVFALFLACGGLALVADRQLSPAPGTG
jgi:hypothetical protein